MCICQSHIPVFDVLSRIVHVKFPLLAPASAEAGDFDIQVVSPPLDCDPGTYCYMVDIMAIVRDASTAKRHDIIVSTLVSSSDMVARFVLSKKVSPFVSRSNPQSEEFGRSLISDYLTSIPSLTSIHNVQQPVGSGLMCPGVRAPYHDSPALGAQHFLHDVSAQPESGSLRASHPFPSSGDVQTFLAYRRSLRILLAFLVV